MLAMVLAIGSAATGLMAVALAVVALIEQRAERYEIDRLIRVPLTRQNLLG